MTDFSHLDALTQRLYNETHRLRQSRSVSEAKLRAVWVAQIGKEIAAEYKFLDIEPCTLTPEEIIAELKASGWEPSISIELKIARDTAAASWDSRVDPLRAADVRQGLEDQGLLVTFALAAIERYKAAIAT